MAAPSLPPSPLLRLCHLCTQDEWAAVEDEAAAAKQLAEALQREVPAAAGAAVGAAVGGGPASSGAAVGVVDDSSTSDAPAAALQLVAVPEADAA